MKVYIFLAFLLSLSFISADIYSEENVYGSSTGDSQTVTYVTETINSTFWNSSGNDIYNTNTGDVVLETSGRERLRSSLTGVEVGNPTWGAEFKVDGGDNTKIDLEFNDIGGGGAYINYKDATHDKWLTGVFADSYTYTPFQNLFYISQITDKTGSTTAEFPFVISNDLNVGIGLGINAPSYKIHAVTADANPAYLFAGTTKAIRFGYGSTFSSIEGVDSTGVGSYQLLTLGGSDLNFALSGANVGRWTSTGLGVGTISPQSALQIGDGTSAQELILYGPNGNTTSSSISFSDASAGISGMNIVYDSSNNKLKITDDNAGADRFMVYRDTGNTGITGDPADFTSGVSNKLIVGDGAGREGLVVYSGDDSIGEVNFGDGTGGADEYRGFIRYLQGDDDLQLGTSSNVRMNIDSVGNVGIGTSSPSYGIDYVGGNGIFRLASTEANASSKQGRIITRHYDNSEEDIALAIWASNGGDNYIGWGGGSSLTNAVTFHSFYTANDDTTTIGTERMRIGSSGDVRITDLAGSYSNGEAYVCVYDNGTIFAKDSACS